MKILKNLIILLLLCSCSNKSEIAEFENTLGKENIETLNSLVIDFETTFLKKKYPNSSTEKAYVKYLTEIESDMNGIWGRPSKKSIGKFNNSQLKNIVYGIPDSIWVINSPYKSRTEYRVRRKYLNIKGEYDFGTLEASIPKVNNEDSLIATLENHYDINYFGKYIKALKGVSKKNKFVEEYLEMIQDGGMLDHRLLAYKMLIADLDFDNYFTKRLILTEIVHRI
jgi:hypothetical protein